MGNTNSNDKYHNSHYSTIDDDEIKHIRTNYKVVDVDWLDTNLVRSKIFNDEYFMKLPKKEEVIHNMLQHYLNDKDKHIYKITDYLCDERESLYV